MARSSSPPPPPEHETSPRLSLRLGRLARRGEPPTEPISFLEADPPRENRGQVSEGFSPRRHGDTEN